VPVRPVDQELLAAIKKSAGDEINAAIQNPDKAARERGLDDLRDEIVARMLPDYPEREAELKGAVDKSIKKAVESLDCRRVLPFSRPAMC
jgi:polyribonucleotide nucleotidyltransferase